MVATGGLAAQRAATRAPTSDGTVTITNAPLILGTQQYACGNLAAK